MMPATDSEVTSMENIHALEDKEGSPTNIPSSVPPSDVPFSAPPIPTTTRPNFFSDTVIETKAVSMASSDCSAALSSPAEASPAKPAVTPPTTFDGAVETSPDTSCIASASDSLPCTGTSLINISESAPVLPALPSTTFGTSDSDSDFPSVLTFKGVSVSLENNSIWKQFNGCGTEMILTKQGRRMFPYCRYRLTGLDPERKYNLVLSIVPSDPYRYRWSTSKWEVNGSAENQTQGLIRAFPHHYSPAQGSEWMGCLVSFYKLKLTNNFQDQDGHIILHSMHRYIPRLHVIPVLEGEEPTPDKPVVMGPESMTFTFPQTEFMAVTTYHNFRITQLKINHNPFAKGFREVGSNPLLNRVTTMAQPVVKTETQPSSSNIAENNEIKVEDLSTKNHTASPSPSKDKVIRLVLKPIMSSSTNKDDPYVPCIRGKCALGELVLVECRPSVEPKEEAEAVSVTPTAKSMTPTSTTSTSGSSPGSRKRRKGMNRHWANSRGREWKAATASPVVVHSPSLTVAMQPELDDVEGLLFVSFTSKEALDVHVRDMPANDPPPASPPTTPLKQTVEMIPETDEEKIVHLEAVLLHDLQVLKHRQTIHPVLQEVGLKLCSLDPTKSIDLQYLGVHLPLLPPNLPEKDAATSPDSMLDCEDEGLPFTSRTGKTSDMTKIKGWRNKFIRRDETPLPHCDGSQKNLSAFCSNMLDEYLESEAQYISERATAFSTNPEGSVAYQLPAKSSSYVKTLDSVLKHRSTASKFPVGANRPCPLSHKPLLCTALKASAPLASPMQQSASARTQLEAVLSANAASLSGFISQRLSTHLPGAGQRSAVSNGQSQAMTQRPPGFNKHQFKLSLMEMAAQNEGLSRTKLTTERLDVALSVILTKEMVPSRFKVPQYPKFQLEGPACGQDFCRLGCVCSSLQRPHRGPAHCRRPECMLACLCFKRKITKQSTAGESEEETQPVYAVANMEHEVQPCPGSHADKLWNRNVQDPDPLYTPEPALLGFVPVKGARRSNAYHPAQPIREEEKDPVYKYFESMMTCARVREFNSKPPPEVTIEPKIPNISATNTSTKAEKTDGLPKMYYRTLLPHKKAANRLETSSNEREARKQIEIQSGCEWDKDRKRVLEALFRRMNQNSLSQRFWIKPYLVRLVTKIFMKKPSGSLVTYRLHISKPSQASDTDEEDSDDSDEEKHVNKSFEDDVDAEEEEPVMRFGVTPFLSGVLPAGRLTAKTKPVGGQASSGLIQVNGKCYNQARLLLGNMGSLHPANRLAAYVTGRLRAPAVVSNKSLEKSNSTNKINIPAALHIKAAGAVVPPTITARKTSELKAPSQPPVQPPQPHVWKSGSIASQTPTVNPVQTFVPSPPSPVGPIQTSSTSSPVSLTVSQSLKTPSFLGQSGTYSFRICPPTNQATRGQNPPGVVLPGGFTLIELPQHGADVAPQQSDPVNTTNTAAVDKASPPTNALLNVATNSNWPGLEALTRIKELLREPGSSSALTCNVKMPSDQSNEATIGRADSNTDISSDDSSSDSSDYSAEGDEDGDLVDIETVEDTGQGRIIDKMKEAIRRALKETRDPSHDVGSARLHIQNHMDDEQDDCRIKRRRKNHTALERQRRSEQQLLFRKLQRILKSDPKTPRLHLLSLAVKEIRNQVETSRFLEEKRRKLMYIQAIYVKKLSLLSGKSEMVIQHKLKQIYDMQKTKEEKVKWSPFFSHLLKSRAALLQDDGPESVLHPDFYKVLSENSSPVTADNHRPTSRPHPLAVSMIAQAMAAAPSQQAANRQPSVGGAPAQVGVSSSPSEYHCQDPGAAAQCKAPPPSTASNPSACTTKTLSLPLIRSKTGRIILPSSLKPLGQGIYTLMVMNPKQKEDGVDSSGHQEKSPFESESNQKTEESSNSGPKHLDLKAPLNFSIVKKFISVPVVAPRAPAKSQEEVEAARLNKTAVCNSLNRVDPIPAPDPSPPVARRGRGRPRKNAAVPDAENGKPALAEESDKGVGETSPLVEESEKMTTEAASESPVIGDDSPVAVKRSRGRPPKRKSGQEPSSLVRGAGFIPTKSNDDSPFTPPHSLKKTDSNGSCQTATSLGGGSTFRPLTRGACGKDFPSAKKRSWIDMEKELDPELKSESE